MPFISTPEWAGIRKGLLEGIEWTLDIKFGTEGVKLMGEISPALDLDDLRAIAKAIKSAGTLDEVRRSLASGIRSEGT